MVQLPWKQDGGSSETGMTQCIKLTLEKRDEGVRGADPSAVKNPRILKSAVHIYRVPTSEVKRWWLVKLWM